ncbi:metallophosphoesterase family protein [Aspergillus melleus]|uniref:metallophosphoesterase family protein n=1 Tax=Aspergillus melleus TaxID=138277 RepID=UPI001E8D52EE|nr:uncharacterized protein LDX57_001166 [Aspergillus melleus]KAH8423407.1 hypothetical protein LDX57_001166 [Aspergillus melleus]
MEQVDGKGRLQAALQPETGLLDSPLLRFESDGTFRITVFSDLHYGEAPNGVGPLKDARTADVVRKVLQADQAQLVVLNGDLITGDGTNPENSTNYLDHVVAPIVDANIPWASTYGNHDNQPSLLTDNMFDREKTYPNSLTKKMVQGNSFETGVTNYFLPVHPSDESRDVPELILWFFDSRGGYRYGHGPVEKRPDWVHEKVVKWFEETNVHLREEYGKAIPSLAFFHIPVNSTRKFQNSHGVDPSKEPGINGEPVISQGYQYDEYSQEWDLPFMRALSNTEGLLATFSGHDHDNDWCFKWTDTISDTTLPGNGLNLCYGRHTGYGSYGNLARGGRHIYLKKDSLQDEVITWIRLENGLVTENVTLNATYGQDEYHPRNLLQARDTVFENMGSGTVPGIGFFALFVLLTAYFI